MREKISKISLFTAMLACITATPSDARVNVKTPGRSYADAYNQVNAMRYQQEYLNANTPTATTASASGNLPVAVDDENLANEILNNTSQTTISDLERCSMTYPGGVFRWGIPDSGIRRNQTPQCVAVVELRKDDGANGIVLATTTLAAGDAMKCNIDMFPESGRLTILAKTELPADKAPTMEDVERQMNEEQKENAGFKIITGAILGGVAGNLLAPKQAGNNKAFGAGKTQMIDTAIGVTAGAGVMAASTYSGKVAGDTIKSTAVNAASGMVIGNMMAGMSGSDDIVATTKCEIVEDGTKYEHDCIIGTYNTEDKKGKITDGKSSGRYFFISISNGSVINCDSDPDVDAKYINCKNDQAQSYMNIMVNTQNNGLKYYSDIKNKTSNKDTEWPDERWTYAQDGNNTKLELAEGTGEFIMIQSASKVDKKTHVYAVFDSPLPISSKQLNWQNLKSRTDIKYYRRNSDGSVGSEMKLTEGQTGEFEPTTRDASDGGIVDLSNKGRTKGTLVGTTTGGVMGGLAGYEGAKTEVSERWVTEIDAYTNSLMDFYCATGGRYLSKYNDYAEIPAPQTSGQ